MNIESYLSFTFDVSLNGIKNNNVLSLAHRNQDWICRSFYQYYDWKQRRIRCGIFLSVTGPEIQNYCKLFRELFFERNLIRLKKQKKLRHNVICCKNSGIHLCEWSVKTRTRIKRDSNRRHGYQVSSYEYSFKTAYLEKANALPFPLR